MDLRRPIIVLTLLLPLLTFPGLAEKFYSFTDRYGNTVFSNYKPTAKETETYQEIELKREDNRPDLLNFDEQRFNLFDDLIMKYSKALDVDYNLIKALIMVESNFNPRARSPKGAMGLMQLMPATAKRFEVANPYDPEENIRGGVKYLRILLAMFDGDLELTLSAYNAGENLVKKIKRIPNIKETKHYVADVIRIYGQAKARIPEEIMVYTPHSVFYRYQDETGAIVLTNVDPPANAKPVK